MTDPGETFNSIKNGSGGYFISPEDLDELKQGKNYE